MEIPWDTNESCQAICRHYNSLKVLLVYSYAILSQVHFLLTICTKKKAAMGPSSFLGEAASSLE